MEEVDRIRRMFLREALALEARALEMEEGPEQAEILNETVSLRILAELRRVKGSLH